MKPTRLYLSAIAVSCCLAIPAPGQNASSQILARGHVAALPPGPPSTATHHEQVDPHASTMARETSAGSGSFPSLSPGRDRSGQAGIDPNAIAGPALTVTFSLTLVLGLFAGLVWITRKFGSRNVSQGVVPKDVLQGLGSTPIDPRTRITLVRCGNRILVMAQTATGVHPLSEITHPEEVRQITAACLGDAKQAFASALRSIEQEPPGDGYLGPHTDSPKPHARQQLFASA